uniref:GGDEF domain-containing protein n=1 Tax=uncultured Anaerotruncus sp. TaxID=905011 RepID=UPI00280B658F
MGLGKLKERCSSRLCRCVLSLAGGAEVRFADEGFFDMAGFSREYLDSSCGGSLEKAAPQLYEQIRAMREQPDNPGRGEAEFCYQRADGAELWLYLNGGPAEIKGERGLECLFLDVTELVAARTRLESITNTIPGGVVQLAFGEAWRILYANDGFYRLNGYTREEYRAVAGDLFIRLMHPDDEAVFEAAVRGMIGTRQTGVADYRVRQKDGSWRWRVAYGKMIDSTEEGVPVIQCVILDNEEKKQLERKLELENERYQAVAQMSDGVLWEYNAEEDEAIVPYSVRSVLVDRMRTPGFSGSAYAQGTVHPEDLPRLEQFRRDLREGKAHILFEFRARQPGGGEYRWHRAEAVTLYDADGRPARTVGRTADIDREKRERLRLRDAAERDALTGLYNRAVVQRLIDERLEQEPPARTGSLFVVDIDNFKAVNDRLGHLFGDILLTNIAGAIREAVRPGDILGRVGGDEFVVLLPGASRAEGERIAGELCARVSRVYAGEFTDLRITASVGAADYPRCGATYVELFRKADRALYRAKKLGKNRAGFYEPDGRGADGEEGLLNLYEMDRPEVRWQDGEMERMLDLFPRILSSSKDIDSAIYLMLDRIGEYCRAGDVGIMERTPEGDRMQVTYLWKQGTGRVPISSEEAFSFSQWPDYLQRFREGVYAVADGALLPDCTRPDRRRALLQCGIYDEGAFSGCVIVCDREGRHDWTQPEIALTLGFARAVTPYILKRRTAAEAQYRL